MGPERQPGGGVVGDHPLPRLERAQLRGAGEVERERELGAVLDRLAGRGDPELPQDLPARGAGAQRVARSRPGQLRERRPPRPGARGEVAERAEGPAGRARRRQRGDLVGAHAADVAEADADRGAVGRAGHLAGVDVGRQQRDPAPLRLVDQRVRRIEAHRLLVEQRAQELRAVVHPQPGRLVGEQPEGRAVGLREAEAREPHDHLVDPLRHLRSDPVGALRALDEAPVVGLDRRLGALAAHRPPQPLGLPRREARERDRDLEHLVLEDDRPERVAQDGLERGVVVGDVVLRAPRASAGGARCRG